ncbi:hypothetical protein AMTRI_Chr11g102000 [Amborella trichopoda]|uniref:Uncharacterized protein n=1 Tax=Amborella trichopoda TaxID=13333 RepID=W1NRY3_AMBTC|nr:hypothetical protein AMTR_s00099p00112540 [Amborella trichopoda]
MEKGKMKAKEERPAPTKGNEGRLLSAVHPWLLKKCVSTHRSPQGLSKSDECQRMLGISESFRRPKKKPVTSDPMTCLPDYNKSFEVHTDASRCYAYLTTTSHLRSTKTHRISPRVLMQEGHPNRKLNETEG